MSSVANWRSKATAHELAEYDRLDRVIELRTAELVLLKHDHRRIRTRCSGRVLKDHNPHPRYGGANEN